MLSGYKISKNKKMREVVIDTETTGLDPYLGHRLIEIGCIELFNHVPTGKIFHTYLNPEREVTEEAFRIHGLSFDFLKDKQLFMDIAREFLDFIGDTTLVIHNATFDLKFINAELLKFEFPPIPYSRALDTLIMARNKFPGSPASLDALCKRFNIDNSNRTKHGALLDAELLSAVYLQLIGGSQTSMALKQEEVSTISTNIDSGNKIEYLETRSFLPTQEELELHSAFLAKIKNPAWNS